MNSSNSFPWATRKIDRLLIRSWQLGQTAVRLLSLPGHIVLLGWKHLSHALATVISALLQLFLPEKWWLACLTHTTFEFLHPHQEPTGVNTIVLGAVISTASAVHLFVLNSSCSFPKFFCQNHTKKTQERQQFCWHLIWNDVQNATWHSKTAGDGHFL